MVGIRGRGGRRAKTLEQHMRDGTFKYSLHKHLLPDEGNPPPPPLCSKPVITRHEGKVPKKWIRNPSDTRAAKNGCWFERQLGEYACNWIETHLKLTEGTWWGQPFTLMAWQRDLLMRLFSWVRWDKEWGRVVRRFDRCLVLLPKKNAKSPTAAAIGLYMLAGDAAHGCCVYTAACDKIQASIVGKHCMRMVRASDDLDTRCAINESSCRINMRAEESELRVLSGDAYRQEGLNASAVIVDELHAHQDARLFDALRYAGVSRPESLLFMISTAGDDKTSICYQQREYAQAVEAGTIRDDGYLSLIAEADDADDWTKPAVWKKANVSLGTTVQLRELARACQEARQNPRQEAAFRRYRLNQWMTADNSWLNASDWNKCQEAYTADTLAGQRCTMGLDLARVHDMTAAVLMFRDDTGDVFRQLPFFWMPSATVEKRKHLAGFAGWIASGQLIVTEGEVCDYDKVFAGIAELADKFQIISMGYDPYRAEELTRRFENELGIERVSIAQTIKNIGPAAEEYERRVVAGTMRHNGHDLFSWQAGHVQVITDTNQNLRPVKPGKNSYKTVDGILAAVMALAMHMVAPPPKKRVDFYDSHAVEFV